MQVCPLVETLLSAALDPDIDHGQVAECRLTMRCAAALLRKHTLLAPDRCAHIWTIMMRALALGSSYGNVPAMGAAGVGTSQPWQRLLVLQQIKLIVSDCQLLYK